MDPIKPPPNPPRDPQPNLNKEPLRTGLPAETYTESESARLAGPVWAVDRMSAGILMAVIIVLILIVAYVILSFLL